MIKAIIFDLGGVLVNTSLIADRFNLIFNPKDKKEFWQELNHEMAPLCKCEITEAQFWKNVARKYGVDAKKIPKNLLRKDFEKSVRTNQELLDLVLNLKRKYKVAVISNIIEYHSKINKKQGLYEHFDHLTLSYEVRMAKDSKEIFTHTLKKLNVKPEECIFIDDVKKFVEVAKSVGMKGILFKDNSQLKSNLKKLLGAQSCSSINP